MVELLATNGKHSLWTDGARWDWSINHFDGTPIKLWQELLYYLTFEACLADCLPLLRECFGWEFEGRKR